MKKRSEQPAYSRALVPKKGKKYIIIGACLIAIITAIVGIIFKIN